MRVPITIRPCMVCLLAAGCRGCRFGIGERSGSTLDEVR